MFRLPLFSVQLRSFSFGFFCNEERLKKHSIVEISESFSSNDYISVLGKERIGSKNTFSPLLIWKEVAVKILGSTTKLLTQTLLFFSLLRRYPPYL